MTAITIRRCGPERARELAELGGRTFRESYADQVPRDELERYVRSAYSPDEVERQLREAGSIFFLADREGRPVGYLKVNLPGAQTDLEEDALEIESIYVSAAHHGMGIGRRLMAQAMAAARDAGLRSIWLGVWERNPRAIAFYERIGFRRFGAHAFEIGEIRHRDVLMRLELPTARPPDRRRSRGHHGKRRRITRVLPAIERLAAEAPPCPRPPARAPQRRPLRLRVRGAGRLPGSRPNHHRDRPGVRNLFRGRRPAQDTLGHRRRLRARATDDHELHHETRRGWIGVRALMRTDR